MEYLKKKKLYELVKNGMRYPDDLPKMKDCTYRFFSGFEWLSFTGAYTLHSYKVSSQCCGGWLNIQESYFDYSGSNLITLDDIYAEGTPDSGYDYHSHHEYSKVF